MVLHRFSFHQYQELYQRSLSDPEGFWGEQGERISWMKPYTKVKETSFDAENFFIRWYHDGTLNACFNCIDRHLPQKANQIAILWEGNEPGESRQMTYGELHEQVSKFANVLKSLGAKRGSRVIIYLPMIPEAIVAMLACARIGAIHSVVFGGFSSESLALRLDDSEADVVITVDEGVRGNKTLPFKKSVDEAIGLSQVSVKNVVVVKRTGGSISWIPSRDLWYHELMSQAESECLPEEMEAEDPLFILYTSGSTGKPKGVLHTTGGYLVYASFTFQMTFNYQEGDIYWSTADIGWITGHSYAVYGPLLNGATIVIYEGIPTYPTPSRYWEIIDKYKVNIFYTAPTAIRALMREGDTWVNQCSLKSLKLLGSVGEPLNPAAWEWYYRVVGKERCAIVDTWWQTETGGIMMTPLVDLHPQKPGSVGLPSLGINPVLVDEKGMILEGEVEGNLVIAESWPGQTRTLFGDETRFLQTYFLSYKGYFYTGDRAYRDEEGHYWIRGRVDDVINVAGHRLSTAEIEGAFASHDAVAEAAVVGVPHDVKGQGIYAFVSLKEGFELSENLKNELVSWVRHKIGAVATPDVIQWTRDLPKTRSGKVMRRILRKIAAQEVHSIEELGELSTLADPGIVEELLKNRGQY